MLDVELQELDRLTEGQRGLLPSEFKRWSKGRQYEWFLYKAAHYRKARWDRERMFAEYDCPATCHEHLRFAYIVSGWLYGDDDHSRMPFIEIEPEEFIKFSRRCADEPERLDE